MAPKAKQAARRAKAKAKANAGGNRVDPVRIVDNLPPHVHRIAEAFAAFSERWPGASEEEFRTFVQHTSVAFGESEGFVLADVRRDAGYDVAAFVIQVDYGSDGSCDLDARNEITRAAAVAGFKNVDSCMSRAAFDFVPGSWERFQKVVNEAAREGEITLTRILLCRAPLGMCFRFPEDIPTEVREGFVEGSFAAAR